jgi:hypothetical protein
VGAGSNLAALGLLFSGLAGHCCYLTFRTNKLFHIDSKQAFSDVEQHKYERDIPAGEGGDQQAFQLLPSKAGDQADIFICPVLTVFCEVALSPKVLCFLNTPS